MKRSDAQSQLMQQLEELQTSMRDNWLEDSLPDDWQGMEHWYPSRRPTTRVTIRLDTEMVRWFRKTFGHGYGQRMNLILGIYWAGLLSGTIKAHPYDNNLPRLVAQAQRDIDALDAKMNWGKGRTS